MPSQRPISAPSPAIRAGENRGGELNARNCVARSRSAVATISRSPERQASARLRVGSGAMRHTSRYPRRASWLNGGCAGRTCSSPPHSGASAGSFARRGGLAPGEAPAGLAPGEAPAGVIARCESFELGARDGRDRGGRLANRPTTERRHIYASAPGAMRHTSRYPRRASSLNGGRAGRTCSSPPHSGASARSFARRGGLAPGGASALRDRPLRVIRVRLHGASSRRSNRYQAPAAATTQLDFPPRRRTSQTPRNRNALPRPRP